jgi:CBS domain-containing protein/gamma-glutamyl:cysteine ligase YbdK (ATP-grasp superfamily)
MGAHDVNGRNDEGEGRLFREALLRDLRAFEQMLESDAFEIDIPRIGSEQEMFLVDEAFRPAPVASDVLRLLGPSAFTTEMGKFNLEANLKPRTFTGNCFREMHGELDVLVARASQAARDCGAEVLLTGTLPTVRRSDLTLENLTDKVRYRELNRAVMKLRGGAYHLLIKGIDELQMVHDNVMPETCCASFQVHSQIDPRRFAPTYNAAQVAAAPVLAGAVNSPVLMGRRLWQETRIALFQHAVDERSHAHVARSHPTRVAFGSAWIQDSVVEIFRDQIARFRVIMTRALDEDSIDVLARGGVPSLSALQLHNGTIWRWNRPVYGITGGHPHLRLEFRALPAGPTAIDEIASAAFFLGLLRALPEEFGDVASRFSFDEAKDNFYAAARHGLKAQLTWLDGKRYPVAALILDTLLPLASEGLEDAGIAGTDIDGYLGVVRERVEADQTGSQWTLNAMTALAGRVTPEVRDRRVVAGMLARQKTAEPVARWAPLSAPEIEGEGARYETVWEIMSTDLFTVSADDPITLAASMMDWRHIRHVPVEDDAGKFVGLISNRDLLRVIAQRGWELGSEPVPVRDVMDEKPLTVSPETSTVDALTLMLDHQVDCLPVVKDNELIGIVTGHDMLVVLGAALRRAEEPKAAVAGQTAR